MRSLYYIGYNLSRYAKVDNAVMYLASRAIAHIADREGGIAIVHDRSWGNAILTIQEYVTGIADVELDASSWNTMSPSPFDKTHNGPTAFIIQEGVNRPHTPEMIARGDYRFVITTDRCLILWSTNKLQTHLAQARRMLARAREASF